MARTVRPAIPGQTPERGACVRAICGVLGHVHRRTWSDPETGARCPRCGRKTSPQRDRAEERVEHTRRELPVSALLALCSAAAAVRLVVAIVAMLPHTALPE